MAFCDLHTHSYYSDGTWSPEQLVKEAERIGLAAVALCDHNTVAGLPDFLAAAAGSAVEPVPGVEFTTQFKGTELHILGLFIQPEAYEKVTALLEKLLLAKEQSNRDLVQRLCAVGLELDYEMIKSASGGYVNRAVIGAEMTRLGYTASMKDAFKRYLAEEQGFYVPSERLDTYAAIRFIQSVGAVAVLAHPFLNLDEAGLRDFLPGAVDAGLCGMEVRYSKFSPTETALAEKIAAEFGLIPSGGSDFHGDNKPDIRMGVGRGDLQIPYSFLQALRACIGK